LSGLQGAPAREVAFNGYGGKDELPLPAKTSFFTNRERAALAWTEALTLITEGRRAPDEVYAEVRKEFGEEDLVNLSLAIIRINSWNRLAIGFRKIPGEYQAHKIG
jgi:alkylhydroperoxidase family enzyme